MECKALYENSPNGGYWANAAHFLFCMNSYEFPLQEGLFQEAGEKLPDFGTFVPLLEHPLTFALHKVCFLFN